MRLDFNQKYYRLRRFLKSTDFSKALLLGSAITFPIIIGSYLDSFNFGLALALGALLCSSSDVNGSPRHKNIGIILSAIIVVIVSLIGGYLNFNTWLFIPVLGILTFAISYLAVFGFRASLIAFSGLFAIVLSFADPGDDIEIYQRAILMGAGGLVYLVISMLHQYFSPRKQTDQYLALTLELTGKYLETRGKLIDRNSDRPLLQGKLIELQTELNEKHEVLRDILISARKNSGNSTYQRKRLLLFIQLVDILELAMAHPVNYEKMDRLMEMDRRPLESFQKLIFKMGTTLEQLSSDLIYNKISPITTDLKDQLKLIYTDIDKFKAHSQSYLDEGLIMLQNLYDYQEKQAQNILKIQQLLIDSEKGEIGKIRNEEITQFITPQEFDPKTLLENFSLDSVIFRHSLRLTVVLVIGYIIGEYFELQNAYWILLTIIVIMRPSYGLTKTRSKQRTAGTVIGAAIAIGIVFLTQNPVIYAVLSVTTLITAFAMVQKNYKTSAIFVTLSVVFIYALLEPNVLEVIQYRVIDTLIGAALATIGNIFIWPSWGFIGIKAVIAESIEANKNYLKEVNNFYINKGKVPTSYKLARKQAFLGLGNLSAAFQRMTQEPRSKQKNLDKIYEVVVLNHNFLTSLASMGTYMQNNPTTKASSHFKKYSMLINTQLEQIQRMLTSGEKYETINSGDKERAEEFFDKRLDYHKTQMEKSTLANEQYDGVYEAQLIYDQLKWLLELAEKLDKKLKKISF